MNYLNLVNENRINYSLVNIKKLFKKLNNFHNNLKIIHITGTNGKGSVAYYISKILKSAGYKTGFYTSPHLINIRERIVINNNRITEKDFKVYSKRVEQIADSENIRLTYFEFLTILAFIYFYDKNVDIAVIECGLGGRLDATNVFLNPLVTILTNVSYDHQSYLGNNLKSILFEKMNIFRRKIPIVTALTQKALINEIKNKAKELKCELFLENRDFKCSFNKKNQSLDFKDNKRLIKNINLEPKGLVDFKNIAVAIKASIILNKLDYNIESTHIRKGLENTFIAGRLEHIHHQSFEAILDVAHNDASINVFLNYFKKIKNKYSKSILVFGILKDKNYKNIVKKLVANFDKIYLTIPDSERALSLELLYNEFLKYRNKKDIVCINDYNEILKDISSKYKYNTIVSFVGSFYLVGKFRKIVLKEK